MPTATGARLPKGWMVTAATRVPTRSCRCGAASTTTPTPSCPDTYGIATGTGYVPRLIVTSGSASAATDIRMITQSVNGSIPSTAGTHPLMCMPSPARSSPVGSGISSSENTSAGSPCSCTRHARIRGTVSFRLPDRSRR